VIVPVKSWSGVNAVPVISPTGARCGFTNGDRLPTAVVGAPGVFVGSAGTDGGASGGGAAVFCCAPTGSEAMSAPPAAAAAPAISVRREIDESFDATSESSIRVLSSLGPEHGCRNGNDGCRGVRRTWNQLRRTKCLVTLRVVRHVGRS